MSDRGFFRDNAGWLIATGAVVLAATGSFDTLRNVITNGGEPVAQVPADPVVSEPVAASFASVATVVDQATGAAAAIDVSRAATVETTLPDARDIAPSSADQLTASLQNSTAPAAAPAPEPTPAVAPTTEMVDLFRGAQEANSYAAVCVADLRNLADQTRVYFPSGGLNADVNGLAEARTIAVLAQECPGVKIRVEGHSDASGNPTSNLRLSQARADAVLDRLRGAGVDTSVFEAQGLGDRFPSGIRGPQPSAYYDRRVEFSVIVDTPPQPTSVAFNGGASEWTNAPCVVRLRQAVAQQNLFYGPRSVTVSQSDLDNALALAAAAETCPGARLRIVGQFTDDPGSGESPATARLRAVILMNMLVNSGISSEQIIVGAPSEPQLVPGRPGLNERRVDFDVIVEEG